MNLPYQLNSLSSHNHLISLDSRSSGIHQHTYSDDSVYDDGVVVNVADTDDSDSDAVDYMAKLEFKSVDVVRGKKTSVN